MLTVLRVTGELAEVGAMVDAINTVSPQTMTPRARKDGYAATVSDSDDWDDHVRAIEGVCRSASRTPDTSGERRGFDPLRHGDRA